MCGPTGRDLTEWVDLSEVFDWKPAVTWSTWRIEGVQLDDASIVEVALRLGLSMECSHWNELFDYLCGDINHLGDDVCNALMRMFMELAPEFQDRLSRLIKGDYLPA